MVAVDVGLDQGEVTLNHLKGGVAEQALAIFEATLSPDHPYTQTVRDNLSRLPPSS